MELAAGGAAARRCSEARARSTDTPAGYVRAAVRLMSPVSPPPPTACVTASPARQPQEWGHRPAQRRR